MSSSNLKWVYGPTHRAQDVSNEAVDEYKSIIQQLYLDQNMTRDEVLSNLQDSHGFSLSANQFSKATNRWGFYKQPRRVQTRIQPPESITDEREAPNPHNPPEELFDFEPDVLDTILETETCFRDSSETVADSHTLEDVQEQSSSTEMDFLLAPPPSLSYLQPHAMDVDGPPDALPCGTDKSLPGGSKSQLHQLNNTRMLEIEPHSISSRTFTRVSFDNRLNNKSLVDYFTCCYLFQEAAYCLERSDTSFDKLGNQVPRSSMDKAMAKYRRDRDKLLANPAIPLDMWSICYLMDLTKGSISDDLLDRLDINDLQFMNTVEACLGLCKKWIGLQVKGLPRGAFPFDSLLLHQNASKAVQNICRPVREQSRFDTWQEAGYLFAFVWSNEQRAAANSSSWLQDAEISGLSPTYFLAIMCRMIVNKTAKEFPDFRTIPSRGDNTSKIICRLYLQAIRKIKNTIKLQSLKKMLITCFFVHYKESDLDLEESRDLASLQAYQRIAQDFMFKAERDPLARDFSQATTLDTDVLMSNFSSLSSSRSSSSALYFSYTQKQYLTLLSSNPAMTRSLASGSSRGSSLNSFRAFQAASMAMATCLKEDQVEDI
ncbi:hypothetical protein FPANT_8163 [Fusarium pseudoanthophilum]|uniref:Clr5 domain-containing protein n=1 Tax=Fusarium pseudoanthophilum TaxID=48495 RepID=A0A8H5P0C3_9HYPO|nr:hypothetical protein FPANT_8163 [Fusarium pseudoanthophilum]